MRSEWSWRAGPAALCLLLCTVSSCGPANPEPYIRAAMEAEARHARAHDGVYTSLEALGPTPPLPQGWVAQLYLGPDPARAYVLLAVPLDPTGQGARLYCGDATGTLRSTSEPELPVLVDGRCPEGWAPDGREVGS